MARRRPKSSNNRWLTLIQVLIMAGVLVFIIFFRDTIGDGASSAFNTVSGTEDIQVKGDGEGTGRDKSANSASDEAATEDPDDTNADAGSTPEER